MKEGYNDVRQKLKKQQKGAIIINKNIKRGDVYYADLDGYFGSEQGGIRPVLIVQNDIGNRFAPTVIAAAITSKIDKAKLPTHIEIKAGDSGLRKDSVVLCEQMRTLDKRRLKEFIVRLSENAMEEVNIAINVSFGLVNMAVAC